MAPAVVIALAGCGSSGRVALARLAANQNAYAGKQVTASGRVEAQRNVNGSRYYVLTDSEQDLVILVPDRRARRFVGERVTVTGRFGIDPRQGRLIRIATVVTG